VKLFHTPIKLVAITKLEILELNERDFSLIKKHSPLGRVE